MEQALYDDVINLILAQCNSLTRLCYGLTCKAAYARRTVAELRTVLAVHATPHLYRWAEEFASTLPSADVLRKVALCSIVSHNFELGMFLIEERSACDPDIAFDRMMACHHILGMTWAIQHFPIQVTQNHYLIGREKGLMHWITAHDPLTEDTTDIRCYEAAPIRPSPSPRWVASLYIPYGLMRRPPRYFMDIGNKQ